MAENVIGNKNYHIANIKTFEDYQTILNYFSSKGYTYNTWVSNLLYGEKESYINTNIDIMVSKSAVELWSHDLDETEWAFETVVMCNDFLRENCRKYYYDKEVEIILK